MMKSLFLQLGLGHPPTLDVELPVAQPPDHSLTISESSAWQLRKRRVQGEFEASEPWLSCWSDGRWVHARVELADDAWPQVPAAASCAGQKTEIAVRLSSPVE